MTRTPCLAGILRFGVAALLLVSSLVAHSERIELVELRTRACEVATPATLQAASSYLSVLPIAVAEQVLQKEQGVLVSGQTLRARSIEWTCAPGVVVEEAPRLSGWSAERRDRTVFVPIAGVQPCDHFANGEPRLLSVSVSGCPSDTVEPLNNGWSDEAFDWHDETRGRVLRGRELGFLPPDYLRPLANSQPGLFLARPELTRPPVTDLPEKIRAILVDRVHRMKTTGLPQLLPYTDAPDVYSRAVFPVEKIRSPLPLVCGSSRCWSADGGQGANESGPASVNMVLPKADAEEVISAFRSSK